MNRSAKRSSQQQGVMLIAAATIIEGILLGTTALVCGITAFKVLQTRHEARFSLHQGAVDVVGQFEAKHCASSVMSSIESVASVPSFMSSLGDMSNPLQQAVWMGRIDEGGLQKVMEASKLFDGISVGEAGDLLEAFGNVVERGSPRFSDIKQGITEEFRGQVERLEEDLQSRGNDIELRVQEMFQFQAACNDLLRDPAGTLLPDVTAGNSAMKAVGKKMWKYVCEEYAEISAVCDVLS